MFCNIKVCIMLIALAEIKSSSLNIFHVIVAGALSEAEEK